MTAGIVDVVAHGSAHHRHGRTARLVLLLTTLIGLAAMHTLGHHGPHLGADHHRGHPAAMAPDPAIAVADGLMCAGDGCGVILTAPMSGGHGPGGWDVCVAVLVAFAVLLLAATVLRARRAGATAHRGGPSSAARPRGPPTGRVGLTLATVSVLRT